MKPVLEQQLGSTKDTILSTIIPRYKYKIEIAKLPKELQIVLPYTASTLDKKLIFIKNSKVACTSITHLLYYYSYNKPFKGNIHSDGLDFHQGLTWWSENKRLLENTQSIIFSIVRDPQQRCLSAFNNFFIYQNNNTAKKHLKAIRHFGFKPNNPIERNFNIFLDYIEESFNIDPFFTDRHWRAQHINLGIGTIAYSHIGKIESLAKDMNIIYSLADINPNKLPELTKKHNATKKLEFSPSLQQQERIKRIYKRDYEIFNY